MKADQRCSFQAIGGERRLRFAQWYLLPPDTLLQGHGGHTFLFLLTSVHLLEPRRPRDLQKWHQGRAEQPRNNRDLVLVIFRIPRDRKAMDLQVPPASSFLSKSPWLPPPPTPHPVPRDASGHPLPSSGVYPTNLIYFYSSVQFSHSVVSNSLRPHGLQHTKPPCPSPTPGVHPNSCPLSQ